MSAATPYTATTILLRKAATCEHLAFRPNITHQQEPQNKTAAAHYSATAAAQHVVVKQYIIQQKHLHQKLPADNMLI